MKKKTLSIATVSLAHTLLLVCCCSPASTNPSVQTTCPPCECAKQQNKPQKYDDEIGELVAAASRKMMHGDGAGCLADLDVLKSKAESLEARLAVTRGQCEMLIGKCMEGKSRISGWYRREMAMTEGRAAKTAEALASMRCRGGNSTDRDLLLVALQELSNGAYADKRSPAFCWQRIETIQRLGPVVTPKDAEDTQITGGLQALPFTGAQCLARAGACDEAYNFYSRLFDGKSLEALPDKEQREKIIRDSFYSSVPFCAQSR